MVIHKKKATINFRVDKEVVEMLHQLAEKANMPMTEYVTVFIRTMYKIKFPEEAEIHEECVAAIFGQIVNSRALTLARLADEELAPKVDTAKINNEEIYEECACVRCRPKGDI
jgi:antitoxin component of RelBE/YafQ-DinJ toxin-antitoxin module